MTGDDWNHTTNGDDLDDLWHETRQDPNTSEEEKIHILHEAWALPWKVQYR